MDPYQFIFQLLPQAWCLKHHNYLKKQTNIAKTKENIAKAKAQSHNEILVYFSMASAILNIPEVLKSEFNISWVYKILSVLIVNKYASLKLYFTIIHSTAIGHSSLELHSILKGIIKCYF